MNRIHYFNYIEERLDLLSLRISRRGRLNLLDVHGHSENFYAHFLNLLYGWQLKNINENIQNVEGIDLVDDDRNLIIQVSATCTKQKVNDSLHKTDKQKYTGYTFHFVSIAKDASSLRAATFDTPSTIYFQVATNIHDVKTILAKISSEEIHRIEEIYKFIKDELGNENDFVNLDSNLASIMSVLSKEDWDDKEFSTTINSFQIERKISFNEIKISDALIREHCIHHSRIAGIYSEFDKLGVNKSRSVLATIRREYLNLKRKGNNSSDNIFKEVTLQIIQKVRQSPNFDVIPIDELELCVDLLVVDAFIRCQIFENPSGYDYAAT